MKKLRLFFIVALVSVVLHVVLVVTDNSHFYNTIQNTILKGRLGPAIDEYGIFSNREVLATNYQPWNVSSNLNNKNISPESLEKLYDLGTVAYLVIKNNEIIHEQYWENYSENSLSNSFSMAKSILNIAVGSLILEGKINSLDDPISLYLPKFDVTAFPKCSIRDLLQMSSGINFDENYINPFAYPAKANYGFDLESLTYSYKVENEPGKHFQYRSGNSQLLSFIISETSGVSTSEYVSKKIWNRIGAKNAALWSLDYEGGNEKGFCCFNSNARDFARIGQLYLNKGVWNGDTIVNPEFVEESLKKAAILDVNGKQIKRYGLHWWLHDFEGKKVFYARGILGQYIAVVPTDNLIVVRLGHKRIKPTGVESPPDLNLYLEEAYSLIN